ncbi:MAG: hypothetical protein ACXWBH_14060, partial [Candidatus Angelobacter sp.]
MTIAGASFGDQKALAFSFDCAKAGEAAVQEFHAHRIQPGCLGVCKITFHQLNVFQLESRQLAPVK